MPRGDKTGPEGKGPKTGRGLGPCSDEEVSVEKGKKGRGPCGDGTPNGGTGRGRGRGQGAGQGTGQGRGRGRRKGANGITYFT